MILSVDRPHRILQCDPSLPDLIDFSVDSVVGRTIRMMLGPKSETQMIDAAIKNALLMQSTKIPVHLYGQSGGEPRPVIVTSTPYQESGEMKGVRLVLEASCKEAIAVTQNIVEEKADQSNEEVNSPKASNDNAFAHEVWDRVCLAQNLDAFKSTRKFRCFRPQHHSSPSGDFAPASRAAVDRFVEQLDSELSAHPSCKVVYCVEEGPRALADAVFLLGAYLLLRMQVGAEEVPGQFSWLSASALRGAC